MIVFSETLSQLNRIKHFHVDYARDKEEIIHTTRKPIVEYRKAAKNPNP